jgi:capsular exopolysaccharide synthesis family protein
MDQTERRANNADLHGGLVTLSEPDSAAAEAFRTLRTSLMFSLVDSPPKAILLTSAGKEEGKSTTCANLAVTLAQAQKNVLVVDCDLRRPTVHKIFGLRNFEGMTDVLTGEREAHDVVQTPLKNLNVITVGPLPPNPTELLSSRRFAGFLELVRESYDYVLVDAPPIGLVSDPTIVATQADGVLLVLNSQKARKKEVRQAVRSLEAVGARVLGTVINNARPPRGDYYRYGYSY